MMTLRNYGLDSIRICFAMNVFNSQKSYYELDELKQLHERLKRQYEFETLWFNKNLDRPTWNKDNTFWNRNLQCLMYTFKLASPRNAPTWANAGPAAAPR